ncbi:diguanylate cyclase [Chitiniphilus purpureus]|uniref:diguanylate cyclase n=1 Tax=Chitiniphilus purpureus TaxID=2981137 RepID=A0ABY6DNU9_9NEIS|nr:GGDEF domain-containing protein [Chitiniphilus sp. CD1]UXY16035.1 diguanylate cyclase [Chitiniphilus sp. CD1]
MATRAVDPPPIPSPPPDQEAGPLLEDADAAFAIGDYARSAMLAGRALGAAGRNKAESEQARALLFHGRALLALGQPGAAIPVLNKALRCHADAVTGASVHLVLGRCHIAVDDAGAALAQWSRVMDSDLPAEALDLSAEACVHIGEVYLKYRDADNAFQYYDLACELAQDDELCVRAHVGLAGTLIGMNRPLMARAALRVAEERLQLPHHMAWQGQIQHHLGTLSMASGDLGLAEAHFRTALALHMDTCNSAGQAQALLALGQLAERQGDSATAERDLLRAAMLADTLSTPRLNSDIHFALSQLYEVRGDMTHATAHYLEYHTHYQRANGRDRRGGVSNRRLAAIEMRLKLLTSEIELSQLRQESDAGRERMLQLEQAAYRDALTGVHNRRALTDYLPDLLSAAEQTHTPLSMLLIDFDHFKQVNDEFSHAIGDAVLREAARLFSQTLTPEDLLLRYGGEEFALVLPHADQQQAVDTAEALRLRVAAFDWELLAPGLVVTISVGCAQFHPGDNTEILLSRADLALYLAKRSGRDRVAVEPAP